MRREASGVRMKGRMGGRYIEGEVRGPLSGDRMCDERKYQESLVTEKE